MRHQAIPWKSFDHFSGIGLLTKCEEKEPGGFAARKLRWETEVAQTQIRRELGFLSYSFHKTFYFLILFLCQAKANSTCFFMLLLCARSYFNPNHFSAEL